MSKFDALERKLNIATSLIEELNIEDYEVVLPDLKALAIVPETTEESTNEVFSLDTLKGDFVIIRQNILKLIATGQRILDSTSVIDPADMKAAQLTALSQMQQTLGGNLQLLVSIYEQIAKIEQTRSKTLAKNNETQGVAPGMTNNGTVTNNNIVFSGDTNQLLSFLKENKNT